MKALNKYRHALWFVAGRNNRVQRREKQKKVTQLDWGRWKASWKSDNEFLKTQWWKEEARWSVLGERWVDTGLGSWMERNSQVQILEMKRDKGTAEASFWSQISRRRHGSLTACNWRAHLLMMEQKGILRWKCQACLSMEHCGSANCTCQPGLNSLLSGETMIHLRGSSAGWELNWTVVTWGKARYQEGKGKCNQQWDRLIKPLCNHCAPTAGTAQNKRGSKRKRHIVEQVLNLAMDTTAIQVKRLGGGEDALYTGEI